MQVGGVLKWNNFPHPPKGGGSKPRWFLCMGGNDFSAVPRLCYLITTTCNSGIGQPNFFFSRTIYPFFSKDCYIYFNEPILSIEETTVINDKNITLKGNISDPDLKTIYKGILDSPYYPKILKRDIHSSLNKQGITGLRGVR
jgi:hypothetical protein